MPSRPNVLFMAADDHRHDCMGCAGHPLVRTPTMDGLAARGVRFTRHQTAGGLTGAVCIPSRAQFMTGLGPFRSASSHVVDDTAGLAVIPPSVTTMPQAFRQAGYRTHAVGKWHNDRASFARSFATAERVFFGGMSDHDKVPLNDFDPTGEYPESARYLGEGFSTELFGDAAIRFLEEARGGGEPFFLYLAFTSPHDPRTPPPELAYDPFDVELPPNFLPEHPFDNGELRVRDELLADFPRTADEVRQHLADYYGMISHQDAWMGRVLAAVPEDTLVVYTADHGLAIGQHGLMGKQNVYDHSIRVPLIVSGPGLPVGRVVDVPTTHADLFPTLAELAGLPALVGVEGRSLASFDLEPVPLGAVYKEVMRTIRDERHKLIRYSRSERAVGTDKVQLFDTTEDPYEMNDLSEDPTHRATLERLAVQLALWQDAVGDPWAG